MAYLITIKDQHEFLNDVASLYETTSRVFMEYVDNSFDSAADLRKKTEEKTGEYRYPYSIKLTISVNQESRVVKFLDNCAGMSPKQLKGLVENINKSPYKIEIPRHAAQVAEETQIPSICF